MKTKITNNQKKVGFESQKKVVRLMNTRSLVASLISAVAVQAYAGDVNLTGIDFASLPGGKLEIRMDFDGTPPDPKAYTIERPARIALDLPGVDSKLAMKKHPLDMGNVQNIRVLDSEEQDRTRVIVELVELTSYTTSIRGNSLFIDVGNDGVKEYLKEPRTVAKQLVDDAEKAVVGSGIKAIDFQRGSAGEGQVVVTLDDPSVDVDVRVEGSKIKVVFLNTPIDANLQRRYDVSDFATPITSMDADYVDGATSIEISPTGEYDYLAYQTDNTYVVSVKPLTAEEAEEKRRSFDYVGEKLTLNFQDIEVRSVLQLIADFNDLNLVTSDSVTGRITLRLEDVPWDQALELILKTKGLDKRQVGNVLMVAPAQEIAEQERQELETKKQLKELAPLQTEFITVRYAKAANIYKIFEDETKDKNKDQTEGLLSSRGRVILDERTNSLIITDTANNIEEIRRLVQRIDKPARQVLIESRIVIASSNYLENIGIRWGGYTNHFGSDGITTVSGNSNTFVDVINSLSSATGSTNAINLTDSMVVDLGVTDTGSSSLSLGYANSKMMINAELSALETSGRGEVVSQPKVVTGDKQKAFIRSGQEVPYLEASSSGRATIKYKEAVLKLEVTPIITPDDRILMELSINQDSVGDFIQGELGSQIPIIEVNEVQTTALVSNGETIVLGGVFRTKELETIIKTPFLGDIPYIGRLFRNERQDQEKQEILIFITPRILADTLID